MEELAEGCLMIVRGKQGSCIFKLLGNEHQFIVSQRKLQIQKPWAVHQMIEEIDSSSRGELLGRAVNL